MIAQKVFHWDDTVIMILTNRDCLRFYETDKMALYTAHTKKDKQRIDDDGILLILSKNNSSA